MTKQQSQEIYGQLLGIAVSTSSSHHHPVSYVSPSHVVSKPLKSFVSECISKQHRAHQSTRPGQCQCAMLMTHSLKTALLQDNYLV